LQHKKSLISFKAARGEGKGRTNFNESKTRFTVYSCCKISSSEKIKLNSLLKLQVAHRIVLRGPSLLRVHRPYFFGKKLFKIFMFRSFK